MKTLFLIIYSLFSPNKETLVLPEATVNISGYKMEIITQQDPFKAFDYIENMVPLYMDNYDITIISCGSTYYVENITYKRKAELIQKINNRRVKVSRGA